MSEKIKQALKFADDNGIDACEYCKFNDECPHHITPNGNGNPCYPPCSDGDPDLWVDEDVLLECVDEYKQGEEE
jgi:hypothetical protein